MQDALRDGRPFRLLNSDVHMPKIDGFGLAEMIRSDANLSDLDIIQLTSAGQQDDQVRCQELRIGAQLTKPVKQSELYNVMLRVLRLDRPDEGGWLSIKKPQAAALPPLRILLAEDSLVNQKIALAVLSGWGHTTVVANNGKEALSILAAQEFDVVLMDVQMPELDGFEATAAIRAAEQSTAKHQYIVAMTAHAMAGDRQRCLDAGMDAYVAKPIKIDELRSVIAGIVPASAKTVTKKSSEPVADPVALDRSTLLARLGGNVRVLVEILQIVPEQFTKLMGELRGAVAQRDGKRIQAIAHTLKGTLANLSASGGHEAAEGLEQLARSGDLQRVDEAFRILQNQIGRVTQDVVRIYKELTA